MLDIRDLGAVQGTDVTSKIAAALAAADRVRIPAGDWFASAIVVGAGKTIATDGLATVVHQVAGQPEGTRLINVVGSNVVIEPLTIVGNIATDTGEQNHGILIRGTGAIANVQIGDVRGKNIRGDVVYIGGLAAAPVTDVKVGKVTADNVLRNGVTITGGERIRIEAAISAGRVGYAIFDIEPNPGSSQACDDIQIGYAKGRRCAISGLSNAPIGRVTLGFLDLNEDYQANAEPAYAGFDGMKYQALALRNFASMHVDRLRVINHGYAAIKFITNPGDLVADLLEIDHLEMAQCSLIDPTYNWYVVGADTYLRRFVVNGGKVTLQAGKKFIGNSPNVIVRNLWCNGSVTDYCPGARLEGVTVELTYDAYVCGGAIASTPGATMIGCRIAFNGGGIGRISAHNRNTIMASDIRVNNFLFPSQCPDATVIASTINGVFHLSG